MDYLIKLIDGRAYCHDAISIMPFRSSQLSIIESDFPLSSNFILKKNMQNEFNFDISFWNMIVKCWEYRNQ
jgi:hypothetical protein